MAVRRRPIEEVVSDRAKWALVGKVATSREEPRAQIIERAARTEPRPFDVVFVGWGIWTHETAEQALAHAEAQIEKARAGAFVSSEPAP